MAGSDTLNVASRNQNDEFYTRLTDIEKELRHYRKHFKGKTVLCNCDDPFESNFFKYFVLNFNRLGLKKLIATCYAGSPIAGSQLDLSEFIDMKGWTEEKPKRVAYKAIVTTVYDKNGDGGIDMFDVAELFRSRENTLTELTGNGDFRSDECVQLLQESDLVVTNPPFSLFREYISQLVSNNKEFIILGNPNSLTCKEVHYYMQINKVWLGYKSMGADMYFHVPDDYKDWLVKNKKEGSGYKIVNNEIMGRTQAIWYTNLDTRMRHEELILVKRYSKEEYPMYVNYDAISVPTVKDIPCDYDGEMGVPITVMNCLNPDQFEIIGFSLELAKPMKEIAKKGTYMQGGNRFYSQKLTEKDKAKGYLYHREYDRIVIKNKHPEQPREKK